MDSSSPLIRCWHGCYFICFLLFFFIWSDGDAPAESIGDDGGKNIADDSGDETDPQQETVVEGHSAYHDLRQFALKHSLAANEHSDTDSSVIRILLSPLPFLLFRFEGPLTLLPIDYAHRKLNLKGQ